MYYLTLSREKKNVQKRQQKGCYHFYKQPKYLVLVIGGVVFHVAHVWQHVQFAVDLLREGSLVCVQVKLGQSIGPQTLSEGERLVN